MHYDVINKNKKMKNTKKIKSGKLNFYIIDDKYITYLSQFDTHIAYNKKEKRQYIRSIAYCSRTLLFCTIIFS